jgi:predicted nucleotidyltransferase
VAGDSQAVIELAKQYINDVRKTMPIDKVYLYGSYARNEQKADSDVDLCFFSSDFENKSRLDILTGLFLLKQKYDREIVIEPNAFPTSEIGNGNPFVNEVIRTGIEL